MHKGEQRPLALVLMVALGGAEACYTPRDKEIAYDWDGSHIAAGATAQLTARDACVTSRDSICGRDEVELLEASFDDPSVFEIVSIDGGSVDFVALRAGSAELTVVAALNGDAETRRFPLFAHIPDEVRIDVGCGYPSLDEQPAEPLLVAPDVAFGAKVVVFGDGYGLFGVDPLPIDAGVLPLLTHSATGTEHRITIGTSVAPGVVTMTSAVDPAFSYTVDVYDSSRVDDVVVDGPQQWQARSLPDDFSWRVFPLVDGRSGCNERLERTITALTPSVCTLAKGNGNELTTTKPLVFAEVLALGTCRYEIAIAGAGMSPVVYEVNITE